MSLPTARIIETAYVGGSSSSSKRNKGKTNNQSFKNQAESEEESTVAAAFKVRASQYDFSPISAEDERKGKAYLTSEHWTTGLQTAVLQSVKKIPLRFIIVDDSGSMATVDGNRSVKDAGKHWKKMLSTLT